MNIHEKYINRCIQIAKSGLGTTRPNPMVGCVIVHKDTIIGEGYTSPYGGPHAEVNAIQSVKDKSLLKKASFYVTLEPCSHYGKTPPCSDLIIASGIPNVVIGCVDNHKKVAGKGIEKLINAGCHVTVGVLEKACKEHHKRFFTYHDLKRPYIILKWAKSRDGFLSPKTKDEQKPVWITGKLSRQLVHKWRSEEQAILVGAKTVALDNPSLTTRSWHGNNPLRIVVDKDQRLSKTHSLFNADAPTLRITKQDIDFSKPIATQICQVLFDHEITSVIVEGGAKTLQHFIDENLWDEARVFIGSKTFHDGTKAPCIKGTLAHETVIEKDLLKVFKND